MRYKKGKKKSKRVGEFLISHVVLLLTRWTFHFSSYMCSTLFWLCFDFSAFLAFIRRPNVWYELKNCLKRSTDETLKTKLLLIQHERDQTINIEQDNGLIYMISSVSRLIISTLVFQLVEANLADVFALVISALSCQTIQKNGSLIHNFFPALTHLPHRRSSKCPRVYILIQTAKQIAIERSERHCSVDCKSNDNSKTARQNLCMHICQCHVSSVALKKLWALCTHIENSCFCSVLCVVSFSMSRKLHSRHGIWMRLAEDAHTKNGIFFHFDAFLSAFLAPSHPPILISCMSAHSHFYVPLFTRQARFFHLISRINSTTQQQSAQPHTKLTCELSVVAIYPQYISMQRGRSAVFPIFQKNT